MGYAHMNALRMIQVRGGVYSKTVLMALADGACPFCGLVWWGVRKLETVTQAGPTRIKASLEELVADGFLRIHAYPRGGRGMTTEYVVAPALVEHTETAPCQRCLAEMKPTRSKQFAGRPVSRMEHSKQVAGRPVLSKPVAETPQNSSPGDPHPPVEPEPPRARAREEDRADPGAGAAAPPIPDDPARRERAEQFMLRLTAESDTPEPR